MSTCRPFSSPADSRARRPWGLEIFQDLGADNLPDWILYPTGGGTGLVGIWKAFQELIGLGLIDPERHRLPRMVAVQGENCAPVVESFEAGLDEVRPVESRGTIADGLDVPGAIMGHGILRTIRESRRHRGRRRRGGDPREVLGLRPDRCRGQL